jgi:hypothetical protein
LSATDGRTVKMGRVSLVDNGDAEIHFRTSIQKDGGFDFSGVPSANYKLSISSVFIGKPDFRFRGYSEDDAVIPTHAFASVSSSVIVKDSDVLDLHFYLSEVPLPPKEAGTAR